MTDPRLRNARRDHAASVIPDHYGDDGRSEPRRRSDWSGGGLLIYLGCFLVVVPILILIPRGEHVSSTATTSNWDCLEAASTEELLAKDPDPFKSVADGKYPCFVLKRAVINGPQLVRRLVTAGVLEGDDLHYGPLSSPFINGFVDYYPEMSYVGFAISQLFRRPEIWASLEKLNEMLREAWDGGDPATLAIDLLNTVLAPSGKKLKPAVDHQRGELQNRYIRIFRPHKIAKAVGNVLHFDGMDHTPLRGNADSNIPVELQFIGSHTLSVNLILQASEAYELGHDVLIYNATRHDVHYAKNPDLLWTCRTVGCWFHEEPFKEFAAEQKIASRQVMLEEGDLYVHSSSRIHRVQRIIGERNRVTLNFFMAYFDGKQDVTMWA